MRDHWRLAAALTTILLAPGASLHAQHEQHPMGAAAMPSGRSAESGLTPSVAADIGRLRAATAPFKSLDSAVAVGYERTVEKCIAYPKLGGMGYHHQSPGLVDGHLDVAHPEILVYRRTANGYELTGVEYEVPYSVVPRDSTPPTIMGQSLKPFDAIKMWYLHVWPWLENPNGIFADWNPRVTCE